jgi:hypothetical protein
MHLTYSDDCRPSAALSLPTRSSPGSPPRARATAGRVTPLAFRCDPSPALAVPTKSNRFAIRVVKPFPSVRRNWASVRVKVQFPLPRREAFFWGSRGVTIGGTK